MTWEEKQNAKLERFLELKSKAEKQSQSARDYSDKLSSMIPFGQPILVGHHSESRHRRDLAKIQSNMSKSIELLDKVDYYEKRVDNIINPVAISSDDENAVSKLKAKLLGLEDEKVRIKARDHAKYELSNLSQNMRQIKLRIEHLERLAKVQDSEEIINGITIKVDKADNRVKLLFPSIPSEDVRTKLKSNGFKWSFYNKAWQRMISDWAVHVAKDIAKEVSV